MNNYKIVIDPGHGGDDPGTSGNGIIEKDLTLDISKYMYELFKKNNIPVYITRNTDETLNPSDRVDRILKAYGNDSNVIVISNHINAGGADGAEVIYALRNTNNLSNLVLNEISKEGQNIRKAYQRRLPSDPSKDYYFIHRETGKIEPIIVEYGFLDSVGDDPMQLKKDYEKYASAVVRAVLKYIGKEDNEDFYIVKQGDSLWSIAKKNNISVNELKQLNNINNNLLSIGQKLKLPNNQNNNNIYIVKRGDNLYSIARKFNITAMELMKYNNLNNDLLSIGQKLKIPTITNSVSKEYIVKKGDNLYSIARKFNITAMELMKYNNLKTNLLSIGQILKIPTNNLEGIVYIVKRGDNLYSIARKFNTNVDKIKEKNKLNNNLLSIGQQLII